MLRRKLAMTGCSDQEYGCEAAHGYNGLQTIAANVKQKTRFIPAWKNQQTRLSRKADSALVNRTRWHGWTVALPLAVFIFASAASLAFAQGITLPSDSTKAAATLPRFEVAAIKPFNPKGGFAGLLVYPGGRIAIGHANLRMLLMWAFNVQMFQVIGGPGWADADYFNIEAKPPESSPSAKLSPANPKLPPNDEERRMLLALLIDRFQLKFHVEKKEGPVYLLERGKGELKLNPPKDPSAFPWFGGIEGGAAIWPTGIAAKNISMPTLAESLSRYFERPVIDRTGIAGSFDFEYRAADFGDLDPTKPYMRDDIAASILTSLRGIGLKIAASKAPIETIVIDHAEQPSPN